MGDLPAASSEMGKRALAWIVANESEFFPAATDELSTRRRLKYLGELALIAGTLRDDHPDAAGLLGRAWTGVESGELISRALSTWPIAATSYLPFLLAGCRSPSLEAQLADTTWLAGHATLPPFVRFAIGVVLEHLHIDRPWSDRDVVLANRFFDPPARGIPAIRAVLLAHAIMWRTRMGRSPRDLDAGAFQLYRELSPPWHRALQETGLLDPLGEMIATDCCVAITPPAKSLQLLCEAQRDDGAMPPRLGDPIATFDELYHPTCVAALAGTMASRAA
jgi:hypothetical protein